MLVMGIMLVNGVTLVMGITCTLVALVMGVHGNWNHAGNGVTLVAGSSGNGGDSTYHSPDYLCACLHAFIYALCVWCVLICMEDVFAISLDVFTLFYRELHDACRSACSLPSFSSQILFHTLHTELQCIHI